MHLQINRVRLPATLFSVSLYGFFFCLVSFEHYFSFWHFFVILTADPAGACTWINIYFKRKSGAYFGKGISKALDLHTGQAYAFINVMPAGGGGGRQSMEWGFGPGV